MQGISVIFMCVEVNSMEIGVHFIGKEHLFYTNKRRCGRMNRNQCDLRDIETLTEQVDSNQHVKYAHPKITHDLQAFQCINIGMQIFDLDIELLHIVRQILRHALRQRRN